MAVNATNFECNSIHWLQCALSLCWHAMFLNGKLDLSSLPWIMFASLWFCSWWEKTSSTYTGCDCRNSQRRRTVSFVFPVLAFFAYLIIVCVKYYHVISQSILNPDGLHIVLSNKLALIVIISLLFRGTASRLMQSVMKSMINAILCLVIKPLD